MGCLQQFKNMTTAETTAETSSGIHQKPVQNLRWGEATVHALNNVTIDFERGKFNRDYGSFGLG